jgi:hypothetical protein
MHQLIVNIVIVSCPVQRLDSSRLQLGMMLVEVLWQIHARRSTTIVHGRNLECEVTLACDHECQRTQESDREEISSSDMRSTYSTKACSS